MVGVLLVSLLIPALKTVHFEKHSYGSGMYFLCEKADGQWVHTIFPFSRTCPGLPR